MAPPDPHAAEARRLVELLASMVRQKGVSRRLLGERLGMSRGALSTLLSGEVDLPLSSLLRILEALGVHPGQFFRMAFRPPWAGAGPAGDDGVEEELVAVLREGLGLSPAADGPAMDDGPGELPTAEGSARPDPARGARENP